MLLTDGDELVSYCTYVKKDDIQPTDLTPWMGNKSLAQKVSFLTGVGIQVILAVLMNGKEGA